MKKIFIVLTALIAGLSVRVSAQEYKFFTGGEIGLSYKAEKHTGPDYTSGTMDNHTFDFAATPFFGYFITKSVAVGTGLQFVYEKVDYGGSDFYDYLKTTDLLLNPFMRFYFTNSLYASGEFQFGVSAIRYGGEAAPKIPMRVLGFGVGFGYDIRLAEHLGLEPAIMYQFKNRKQTGNTDNFDVSSKQQIVMFKAGLVYRF